MVDVDWEVSAEEEEGITVNLRSLASTGQWTPLHAYSINLYSACNSHTQGVKPNLALTEFFFLQNLGVIWLKSHMIYVFYFIKFAIILSVF